MENTSIMVEKYLMKNFPGKKIRPTKFLNVKEAELYGINSIQVLVLVDGSTVYYKINFDN